MPARDPDDQRAAREFEQDLRHRVFSGRAPESELAWFLSLPKRVRRSRVLIGEALGPARDQQTRARVELERRAELGLERAMRLAELRSQPRDLSVLHSEGSRTWEGLGRRKKRCRKFTGTGRAFVTRQHLCVAPTRPTPPPAIPSPPARSFTSCAVQTDPSPDSLCSSKSSGHHPSVNDHTGVSAGSKVPTTGSPTAQHSPTPPTRTSPAASGPPCCALDSSSPTKPFKRRGVVWTSDRGHGMDAEIASVMSYGRFFATPWAVNTPAEIVACFLESEDAAPFGVCDLWNFLFPNGTSEISTALMPTQALLDLIDGWRYLVRRHWDSSCMWRCCHCGRAVG